MIALTIYAVALIRNGQEMPTPGSVISTMMNRYASATTMTGHINFTQSARSAAIHVATDLAYVRPSKIYIHQSSITGARKNALLICDGKTFAYDRPPATFGPIRFIELVTQTGRTLSLDKIYAASHLSLLDRSAPLDLAVGANLDLRKLREQWSQMKISGPVESQGISSFVITGDWRENADHPVMGTFSMNITQTGDLLRYEIKQRIGIPPAAGGGIVDVSSVWDCDFRPDSPVDPGVFAEIK